jgi:outer membrane protein assembly factor BamB
MMATPRNKLVILFCLAASAARGQGTFRGDAWHSGVYAASGPRALRGVKWRFATGGKVIGSAVWSEGTIYFGSDDGNLYAVDAATGKQRWQYPSAGPVASTPAVDAGMVYFGSYDGKFYAVDAKTGALRWKVAGGGERRFEAKGLHGMQPFSQTFADPYDVFLSSPVVAEGAVYFGSGDGNVYAFETATGAPRWKFHTGDVVHASPAVAGGTVYFGSWDGLFYAVEAATGKEKWRFQGGKDDLIHNQIGFQSSPAVVDGVVYTGCRDSNLYALDAAAGKEKWRVFNQGSWVNSSPAVLDGKVYYATADSSLFHAVDAATGKPVFQQKLKAYVFSSPSIAGEVVYLGLLNGTLEARDRASGELLWTFQTETSKENRDWVLTGEGKLNPAMFFRSNWNDGGILAANREYSIGSIFSAPSIVNGVVYVGSTDGFMYAVE